MPGRERNIRLERRKGKWTETWMAVLDVRFSLGVREKEKMKNRFRLDPESAKLS